MKEQLFDLIAEQNLDEVFHIISENASSFPDYQTFRERFEQDYIDYKNSEKLAYRKALKTFVDKCLPNDASAHFITDFFRVNDLVFVGRENEFETLHKLLQANLAHVAVQSIGGIGKTTFVRCYAEKHQQHYQHIAYIEQISTLVRAFVSNKKLIDGLAFKKKTEIECFEMVMEKLGKIKGNNLLIIDNYTAHPEDTQHKILQYFRKASLNHWRVLCTSREEVHGFKSMCLEKLPEAKAIELFRIYTKQKNIQEIELKELLKLIDYHTLTIELLAKSYQHSLTLDNLAQLTDILRQNSLEHEDLNNVIPIDDSQEEKLFYQHLNKVFNILPLSKNERYLLKQFAVLPPLPIAGKDFLTWITPKSTWASKIWHWVGKILGLGTTFLFIWVQNKATYEKALRSLAKKGWLTYHADKTFEVHRFVRMFLLHKFQPNDIDCFMLYHSFIDMLATDKVGANPLAHQWLLEYGEALLADIHFKAKPIWKGNLQDRLANLYKNLSIYTQAERLYEDALYLTKEALGTKCVEYANALSSLALLYETQDKYDQAELLYQEALQIDKKTIGTQHADYAKHLNNLATLYNAQGKYEQAEPLYQEALQIDKETIGTQHPFYAIHLHSLANLYDKQGKYEQAKSMYQEALQITKETVGKQHTHYASYLHNLGCMYYKMGRYKEAKALLTEAYTIRVTTLGEQHPYTQNTKKSLDAVEAKL